MINIKKVLILFGGNSKEHLISCLSARSILENIDYNLFSVCCVGIDFNNEWVVFNDEFRYLENGQWQKAGNDKIENIVEFLKCFDVILPLTHGFGGEDGKLQGMFDLFGFKYVGSKALSSGLGMDKEMAKILFNSVSIPQVPYVAFNYPQYNADDVIKKLGNVLIVKPCNGGSSIGVSKVCTKKELIKGIKKAYIYDKKIMVEKFIEGRELECGVLIDKKMIVSEVGEIISCNDFYDYEAKYENRLSSVLVPACLDKKAKKHIRTYTKMAFERLGANGFARVDFFYDEANNEIYLNEINTIPGFTSISMYPKLFIEMGYSYKKLITVLINNA